MKNFILFFLAICVGLLTHSQVPSYVPTDGLVAWYEMNGGALDSSPNENHGIPTGVSAYPDRNGIESGALWFNGSGDHITVPFSESIGIQAEFSSAVWVYLQGGGCNPRVYEIHESLNCGGYNLAFNGTSGNPRTFHGSNFGNCQLALAAHSGGTASVQPGEWHHIAVTFTPGPTSNGKLYVDGVLVNEATHPQDISGVDYYGAPLYIGNIAPNRCDWYGGGMDELGFWEKALSPDEIWSLYVGEPLNLGCTDETACNYDLDANSDDGSCIPSGCMDPEACNFNDLAECEGEACDYSCPEIPVYVPTNGLVAWFPFNGNANDESLNGHDADVDGATLSMDRFGNSESAYVFDGNDRIFPSNPEGFPVAERTTSIWMKSNVEVTGGRALFGYGGGSCGSSWLLTYNNQGNQPLAYHSFELQGHCNAFGTAASLPSSEFLNWHHVVLRTSEEGTDIFVDGVLTTQSTTFVNNTQPNCAVLGAVPSPGGACVYQDSSNDLWNGLLDDFAIWDRALTDQEIELLYFSDFETGCTDSNACNFEAAATLDDGSCEYGCNYCGPGTTWDADAQICVVTTSPYLNEPGEAAILNPCYFDSNGNGLVEVTDLMNVLSVYGLACGEIPEPAEFLCGNPLSYQGYDYETVMIGEQCWFAENARYLPAVSPPEVGSVTEPHAYVFGYSGNDVSEAELLHGAVLYNGIALSEWDICPSGWHVPSEIEWQVLESLLGMSQDEIDIQNSYRGNQASALKSGSEGWQSTACSSAAPGTNEFGFGAEPVGIRHFSGGGTFTYNCAQTTFWSSTDYSRRALAGDKEGIYRSPETPEYGFSVRCIQD